MSQFIGGTVFFPSFKKWVLFGILFSVFFHASAAWYNGQWGYRGVITLNHTKVANTSQTDFPVLVSRTDANWKSTSNGGHVGQTDGGDIVFTDSNGIKLNHEIEKYDPVTGELIAWVKIPTLSATVDTIIYMYYGNASVADQWNKVGVWDNDFKGVWHLGNTSSVIAADATSNANNGVLSSTPPTATTGQLHGAASFNGTNNYIDLLNPSSLQITGNQTIEMWLYPTDFSARRNPFAKAYGGEGTITQETSGNLTYYYGTAGNNASPWTYLATGSVVSLNTWVHLVAVRDFATSRLRWYVNGVMTNNAVTAYPSATASSLNAYIGKGYVSNYSGRIDEVRISASARSADWIKTEYNNQNSPSTFYTSVIQEVVPICDAVTDVPASECQALMSIYNNTGGDNWTNTLANDNKWGVSTIVNDWYGVDVWDGHVVGLGLQSNNLTGGFEITEGNLNQLNLLYLNHNHLNSFNGSNGLVNIATLALQDNNLTSFDGAGLSSLTALGISENPLLTSFSGSNLSHLQELGLNGSGLTSFSGVGLSSLTSLDLTGNNLTSFSGVGLSSLTILTLDDNQLTSFSGTGLSSLIELYLINNQLTSFSGTGLSSLVLIEIENNLISSLNTNITTTNIPQENSSAIFGGNCFDPESLPINIVEWLDSVSVDDWRERGPSCPALSSTMWFFGTDGNWNNQSNWYYDAELETGISPKLRPDAADNVIILSNISSNTGDGARPAIIKTLQVLGDAQVAIPIRNGGGYTYTTNLPGDNNDIVWRSSDPAVTITYANPTISGQTDVTVSGKNITVTPGNTPAWLQTSWPSGGPNRQLRFEQIGSGPVPSIEFRKVSSGVHSVTVSGTDIRIDLRNEHISTPGLVKDLVEGNPQAAAIVSVSYFDGGNAEITPTGENIDTGGPITLIPGASADAQSIITAVGEDAEASLLVSGALAPNNDGTGTITDMSAQAISIPATTYTTPMSFLNTSVNATGNILTGDASFECTAQNLGIVTGKTVFTSCPSLEDAPSSISIPSDTTPTFTGYCNDGALVTLYSPSITRDRFGMWKRSQEHFPILPSVLCEDNFYSITPTLPPGKYSITAKQSNRKGPIFGTSPEESPALDLDIGCSEGERWNGTTCTLDCDSTEAPSELKAGVDKPYISCNGGEFKYKISQPSGSQYEYQFGSYGSGNAQFINIPSIVINSNGYIYVVDSANNRIQKFNSNGSYISQFGSYGQGDGQFDRPMGIAFGNGGYIYVVDSANNRIQKFNSNGSYISQFGSYGQGDGQFDNPEDIQIDAFGNIYVLDSANNRIQKFNSNGSYISQFGSYGQGDGQFENPTSIALDSNGNIYVSDFSGPPSNNNRIQKFNSNGIYQSQFGVLGMNDGQLHFPEDIQIDASGDIYVVDSWNHRIQKFNSNGIYQSQFGSHGQGDGQFENPTSIALDSNGNIYVADNGNRRIQTFSQGSNFVDFISTSSYPSETRVLHTGELPKGKYTVQCLYNDYTTPDSCAKTMVVRESTAGDEVQGCARITNNFENFVGYEKWIHNTGFNASIGCIARKADPEITDEDISPFLVQYGTDFTPLGYLNNLLDLGRFTSEIDIHSFDSSLDTSTTCAVRVGDGYSTNSLCQNLGCGGPECDAPSQYLIQPAATNLYCTAESDAQYTIGCAPGDSYASCILDLPGHLYNNLTPVVGGGYTKNLTFRFDDQTGQSVEMTCGATLQSLESQTPTCTVSLPTGKEIAMLIATDPIEQYQIVYDPVPRDIEDPMATITGKIDGEEISSSDSKILTSTEWINKPVVANIRCTNTSPENNDSCTCAWLVKADTTGNVDNTDWGLVTPLKDIVDYQRIIRNETLQNQEFFVFDNVGNMDPDKSKVSITLGVDTLLPSVALKDNSEVTLPDNEVRVTLEATDNTGGSGLWGYGLRWAVVPQTSNGIDLDINTVFDTSCNVKSGITPTSQSPTLTSIVYAPFPDTGAGFGPLASGGIKYNTLTEKIVYCIQDNAKNRLIGTYPFDPNLLIGCFSDGSQQFVPNLDAANPEGKYYMPNIIERITDDPGKYGYELTDSSKQESMKDFRTKLAQNIETLIKQQYCPTTTFNNIIVNLEEKISDSTPLQYAAKVKTAAGCDNSDSNTILPRNTQGYYYFKGIGQNDIVDVAGVARLTGTKVLIVEGADIYLRGDIHYFSRESSLTIIAIESAGHGGNVYINPEVTNIDATIIADGALMNAIYTTQNGLEKKIWYRDSAGVLQNPLVINGRLLTYNTRGGSLRADGNFLKQANIGFCVSNLVSNPATNTCSLLTLGNNDMEDAALQDLERFRVVMRVPDELGNRCTLHVTGVSALNRPDILIRSGF